MDSFKKIFFFFCSSSVSLELISQWWGATVQSSLCISGQQLTRVQHWEWRVWWADEGVISEAALYGHFLSWFWVCLICLRTVEISSNRTKSFNVLPICFFPLKVTKCYKRRGYSWLQMTCRKSHINKCVHRHTTDKTALCRQATQPCLSCLFFSLVIAFIFICIQRHGQD